MWRGHKVRCMEAVWVWLVGIDAVRCHCVEVDRSVRATLGEPHSSGNNLFILNERQKRNKIIRKKENKNLGQCTDIYSHMPILRPHAARFHERRISTVTFTSAHLYFNVYMRVAWPALSPICPILCFWGAKFTKMWDCLKRSRCRLRWELCWAKGNICCWTPINHREKFEAASFVLGGEIRNRTNTQTQKQTVADISTPLPIGMCG